MTKIENNKLTDKSHYHVRELGVEWNEKLLAISRESPVESGGLSILFDRSPDIFTIPKLTSQKYRCGGLFKDEELIGYAISTFQKRYIGHQRLADLMYLGNMHVTKKGRGAGFFLRMSNFFFGDLPDEIEFFYAYIMEHNKPALNLVNRRHPQFPNAPYAKVVGQISMTNIFITIPVRLSPKYAIRTATINDINPIVDLLQNELSNRFLAPEMNREIFLRNLEQRPHFGMSNYMVALSGNEIVGVCSAWDMTPLKKNRILEYGSALRLPRLLYNATVPLFGIPSLPKAGDSLKDITITEYAIKGRDPSIMNALLRYVYMKYRDRGHHSLIFGSSVDDPLLSASKSFFSKEIRSNVILSSKEYDKIERMDNIPLIYADSVQI